MSRVKISLGLGLWLVVGLLTSWRLSQFFTASTQPYRGGELFFQYQNSAYFKGEKGQFILTDAQHNAVRGFQLVELNADPEQMLPGHPLFGSWLYGLTGKFVGQPLWINFVATLVAGTVIYLLGLRLLGQTGAQVGMIMFLAEPMLAEQLQTTMLDVILLALALVAVYGYINWLDSQSLRWLGVSQLALGLAMATKFWPAVFPLVVALYLTTVISGNFRRFCQHTLALLVLAIGFVFGHWQYFWFHRSPLAFITYQRYLISWWAGSPQVPPFQVWDLIFANRWHTWWGQKAIVAAETWWILWPATVSLLPASLLKLGRQSLKQSLPYMTLAMWVALSLLMFSFSATYPRHLFLVMPAIYLLSLRLFFSPELE